MLPVALVHFLMTHKIYTPSVPKEMKISSQDKISRDVKLRMYPAYGEFCRKFSTKFKLFYTVVVLFLLFFIGWAHLKRVIKTQDFISFGTRFERYDYIFL